MGTRWPGLLPGHRVSYCARLCALKPKLGFNPADSGADGSEGVGAGTQLGCGVGVLVQTGEFPRGQATEQSVMHCASMG